MMWNYGFGWFFPGLFWILFWVLIVALFWGRGGRWHDRHSCDEKSAEDILDERFASGEIDEKEYEKRLEILRKHAK